MAALEDSAVNLSGITKCYGQTVAVDDLTLSVRPGELFAFIGPNAAGKPPTIKMIIGLLRPDRGDIHVGAPPLASTAPPAPHDATSASR